MPEFNIAEEGHEIAYHGHNHRLLLSEDILISQFNDSKDFLRAFRPKGFRAPYIYFNRFFFKSLNEHGFKYDSSIYAPSGVMFAVNNIIELPVSTYSFRKRSPNISFPRQLERALASAEILFGAPYFMAILKQRTGYFIKKLNKKQKPSIMFLHSWQIIKPENAIFPNFNFLLKNPSYFPYLINTKDIFIYLLKNFKFCRMIDYVGLSNIGRSVQ